MIAIYSSYKSIRCEDDELSLAESIEYWQEREDYGECYLLGIYDPSTKTMHISENMDIVGKSREIVLSQKQEEFKELRLEIEKIEFYDQSE